MLRVGKAIITFFSYCLLAIGSQNVLFTRGLGTSNALRVIRDERKDTGLFCLGLAIFMLLDSIRAYFLLPLIDYTPLRDYVKFAEPAAIVLISAFSYIIVIFLFKLFAKTNSLISIIHSFTTASINSAVVGTIVLMQTNNFDLIQTIGFALGSAAGYFLAMVAIDEGERRIDDADIPVSFRGLPIRLLYVAILALGVYGLVGHSLVL